MNCYGCASGACELSESPTCATNQVIVCLRGAEVVGEERTSPGPISRLVRQNRRSLVLRSIRLASRLTATRRSSFPKLPVSWRDSATLALQSMSKTFPTGTATLVWPAPTRSPGSSAPCSRHYRHLFCLEPVSARVSSFVGDSSPHDLHCTQFAPEPNNHAATTASGRCADPLRTFAGRVPAGHRGEIRHVPFTHQASGRRFFLAWYSAFDTPYSASARARLELRPLPESAHQVVSAHHAELERACHTQQIVPIARDQLGVDGWRVMPFSGP
jgi:hypothetical protein